MFNIADRDTNCPFESKRYAQCQLLEDALSEFGVKVSYAYREHRQYAEDLPWAYEGSTEELKTAAPFFLSKMKIYKVEEYDGIENNMDDILTDYRWIAKQSGDRLCRILAAIGHRAEVLITTNTYDYADDDMLTIWLKVN